MPSHLKKRRARCPGLTSQMSSTQRWGQPFKDWVNSQVDARNEKVAIEGDNVISMDPRIAEIFLNSTAISGKSQRNLIKTFHL